MLRAEGRRDFRLPGGRVLILLDLQSDTGVNQSMRIDVIDPMLERGAGAAAS
jgi:hypothetical protein